MCEGEYLKKLTLEKIQEKIITYQMIVMMSFIFGVVGFVYNNWRYEHNEYNNNIRIASFQMIQELAALEQNIYANHYDKDPHRGSPRDGWVKIGLINDLALFISPSTQKSSTLLKETWKYNWQNIENDRNAIDKVVEKIEDVRKATRVILRELY